MVGMNFARRMPAGIVFMVTMMAFIVGACASVEESSTGGADQLLLTGMMQMTDVGPGCWQLLTEDGKSYEVTGITAGELHRDGLRVQIRVRVLHGIGSVCTVGQLVELLEIIRISY